MNLNLNTNTLNSEFEEKNEKEVSQLSEDDAQYLAEKFILNNTVTQNNQLFDFDFNKSSQREKLQTYRKLSKYSEVENAIDEIINECIVETQEGDIPIQLNLNEQSQSYEVLKEYCMFYYDKVIKNLHLRNNLSDLFKTFYIDGYLTIGLVRSKEEISADGKGKIESIMFLDPTFLSKNKNVYKYRPEKTPDHPSPYQIMGQTFNEEDVIFTISGSIDTSTKTILSPLHKAVKPANLLYLMEDASTVYALVRAPSRRVWSVAFGNISNTTVKQERIMKKLAAQNKSKISYDTIKGGLSSSDSTHMSLTEDIYLPKTNSGPDVSIDVLNGDVNAIRSFEPLILYFKEKLYESLNVPFTRMKKSSVFASSEGFDISREEYKFSRFIIKIRRSFSDLILKTMYAYMKSDGIVNGDPENYEELKELIFFKFKDNNVYKERQMNIINDEKLTILAKVSPFIGTIYSQYYVYKNMLNMTDEEIEMMQGQIGAEGWNQPPVDINAQPPENRE